MGNKQDLGRGVKLNAAFADKSLQSKNVVF